MVNVSSSVYKLRSKLCWAGIEFRSTGLLAQQWKYSTTPNHAGVSAMRHRLEALMDGK